MSYLIFCSFEVGAFPYRMADILNAHGVETYYASVAKPNQSHDSTQFHYGHTNAPWDLTPRFREALASGKKLTTLLHQVQREFRLTHFFATGQKAYLLRQAGLPYHYWSYGADLDYLAFFPVLALRHPWWAIPLRYLLYTMRFRRNFKRAICGASALMIAPYQLPAYQALCPDKPLFFLPHFFKIADLEVLDSQKMASRRQLEAQMDASRFFFSSTRHMWSGPFKSSPDSKGNDVILHAFREYLDLSGDERAKLVLVAKGMDVEATRALAQEIDLTSKVVWIKEMKRDLLDQYYQGAAACFGQFGTPVLTFTALEPMAQASVSISAYGGIDHRLPFYTSEPPILKSKDPKKIGEFLTRITTNPKEHQDLCRRSWEWIRENCSEEKFVAAFIKSFKTNFGSLPDTCAQS